MRGRSRLKDELAQQGGKERPFQSVEQVHHQRQPGGRSSGCSPTKTSCIFAGGASILGPAAG